MSTGGAAYDVDILMQYISFARICNLKAHVNKMLIRHEYGIGQ